MTSFTTKLLAVAAMFTATSAVTANEYNHINSLAVQIQNKTKRLVKETHHYRYTPSYPKLVACTTEIARLARHIRQVARVEGDVDHLAADFRKLDAEFHRIERVFDRTEIEAANCRVARIHGNTRHVKKLLNRIEDCIHHMRADVEEIRRRAATCGFESYARPVVPVTRVPGYGVYGSPYGSGYRSPYGSGYGWGGRSLHGSNYGYSDWGRGISLYGGGYDDGGLAIDTGRLRFNIGF